MKKRIRKWLDIETIETDVKEVRAHEYIKLTEAEIQSGNCRVRWAEGLIEQLPQTHDGRNSWLLNYGIKTEAKKLRQKRNIVFHRDTKAAETFH